MNTVKILLSISLYFLTQNSYSQAEKKVYQRFSFGMEGSIGIPLETINIKKYYLQDGETITDESGRNEPLYGAGIKLSYELTLNQGFTLEHNVFNYEYDYSSFGINQFPDDRWTYELRVADYTEFKFNALHLKYFYKFNLGMLKPYFSIGLGHYWVATRGNGFLRHTDTLHNTTTLFDSHESLKFQYFNIKLEFGFDIFFNTYFGMTIYGNFDIPLSKPKSYSLDYDAITEETDLITKVERTFIPPKIFNFGIGMFFYLPEIKKAAN